MKRSSINIRMMQNFCNHITTGEPLLAPGLDGIYPLQLANGAYLSSVKVDEMRFPIDAKVYDELLLRLAEEERKSVKRRN